ncbi:MAG: hypothetical protein JXA67_04920 [Micromonosporaceae bacterium]|nr:hypothetical protein [Micromonosporaceae bacterium]
MTLVSAIFAIVATQGDGRPNLILLTLVPAWIFWALDAYYLYQERLFRALYDAVARSLQDDAAAGGGHDDAAAIEVPLFDMNLRPYRNSTAPWWKTALAPHVAAIPVTLSLLVTCFWIASW